jgi:hypothetical protein
MIVPRLNAEPMPRISSDRPTTIAVMQAILMFKTIVQSTNTIGDSASNRTHVRSQPVVQRIVALVVDERPSAASFGTERHCAKGLLAEMP